MKIIMEHGSGYPARHLLFTDDLKEIGSIKQITVTPDTTRVELDFSAEKIEYIHVKNVYKWLQTQKLEQL